MNYVIILLIMLISLSVLYSSRGRLLSLMIKEIASPHDYEKTLDLIKKTFSNSEGWRIVNIIDQGKKIIENGGDPVGRITIIQYCHSIYASQMFKDDNRKKISVFSPKSIAVYEKSDGKTYISLMNSAIMKFISSGEMKEIVKNVSGEVGQMMAKILRK